MGKKSKEETQLSEAFSSLFTADNPFRRKNEPVKQTQQEEVINRNDEKKRKRDKNKNSDPNPIPEIETQLELPKKRKKMTMVMEIDEDVAVGSPRKKRKRREIEEEYELRVFGESAEGEMGKNREEERKDVSGVTIGRKRKAAAVEGKDMVVRKEAFDDESKLLRTVFVGNLPLRTKRKDLFKEFATFGEIESIRIRSVPVVDSKAPRMTLVIKGEVNDAIDRVNAYIVFKDEQSAQAALSHNMVKIGGNHIRVDKACPPRKKMKGEAPIYSVKKTVFVGNLPFDVKDEEVYQVFCEDKQVGSSVEAVRVVRDPHSSQGKGIAYVLFKTREAANSVVKKEMKLRDRVLRLSHAKPEAAMTSKNLTPSKRKNTAGPSQANFNKKPATSPGMTDNKGKLKADSLSYQGLRSSKSGVLKKVSKATVQLRSSAKGRTESTGKEKILRMGKRPAVAARKAQALKRKSDTGTPEMSRKHKKARHSK